MYVDFGEDPDHTWRLYLTHGGFGDTGTSIPCGDSVERGLLLACESTIAKGGIAIDVTVLASIRNHVIGAWSQVDQRSLTTRDLPNVRLQRRVQVTRPDRTVVSVREQIFGPASLSADAVFDTSVDTMTRLADDPALRLHIEPSAPRQPTRGCRSPPASSTANPDPHLPRSRACNRGVAAPGMPARIARGRREPEPLTTSTVRAPSWIRKG